MKKIVIFGLLFMICSIKVDALYCSYSDINYLKQFAANINISYDYIEENNDVTFKVKLVNLHPELYIVDQMNKQYNYKNNELIIDGYRSGQTIQFKVYSTREYCSGELLRTIRLTLPSYNKYYKNEVCRGVENYTLCSRWSSHNLNQDDFVKKVNAYKESIKKDPPIIEQPVEEETSIMPFFIKILLKFYYIPLILVIIGCGIGIYIENKKDNAYY